MEARRNTQQMSAALESERQAKEEAQHTLLNEQRTRQTVEMEARRNTQQMMEALESERQTKHGLEHALWR